MSVHKATKVIASTPPMVISLVLLKFTFSSLGALYQGEIALVPLPLPLAWNIEI